MNEGRSAIGKDDPGSRVKSCSASPGLWTMTIAWGVDPWSSPSVTAGRIRCQRMSSQYQKPVYPPRAVVIP